MTSGQRRAGANASVPLGVTLVFGTPRRLPKPASLGARVVVLDLAFASESGGRKHAFARSTGPFIAALGARLVAWVDHHDSHHHACYRDDPRFVLATKAEHGACLEMIDPALVARAGPVDTILCHTDFDGLASAAKWLLGGREPYPGCDADARAIDTRVGRASEAGARCDRALRARPNDAALQSAIVRHLLGGRAPGADAERIERAAAELAPREEEAARLAQHYRLLSPELALVDVDAAGAHGVYDKTSLLLLGQQRARIAAVLAGDTVTFAAPFDGGVDLLRLFGLSGGMPTLVSLPRSRLGEALAAIGVRSPH